GVPDTILQINVTPNRPDALSHVGIARELSAITGVAVRVPPAQPAGKGELPARIDIEDTQRCPRYVARVIEGVHIGPSPLHVQERLRACGVRPISNVVDATNLALLELGHPLHGFDLDRLAGRRILVRRAREGEPMTTLDGKERKLSADDLVIADGEKPVALAGVMGGQTSEVGDGTTRVLLESAMFDPAGIRRTSRRHALHTEASHRFERGMDERTAEAAANRCAELIVQPAGVGETAAVAPQRRVTAHARAALSAHGFDEALNYSFLAEKDLAAVSAQSAIRLANPLTTEQGAMRTTLLAGLLRNVAYNLAR